MHKNMGFLSNTNTPSRFLFPASSPSLYVFLSSYLCSLYCSCSYIMRAYTVCLRRSVLARNGFTERLHILFKPLVVILGLFLLRHSQPKKITKIYFPLHVSPEKCRLHSINLTFTFIYLI